VNFALPVEHEAARTSSPSLPGLTRQSMLRSRFAPVGMDARVKPAHDEGKKFPLSECTPEADGKVLIAAEEGRL